MSFSEESPLSDFISLAWAVHGVSTPNSSILWNVLVIIYHFLMIVGGHRQFSPFPKTNFLRLSPSSIDAPIPSPHYGG